MEGLANIILNGKFEIQEAGFATVDSIWSKFVGFYQFNRFYLITDGEAKIKIHNAEYILRPDTLYFIPAKSIMSGECSNLMSHYYIHFHIDPYLDNLLRLIIKPFTPNKKSLLNEKMFELILDAYDPNKNLSDIDYFATKTTKNRLSATPPQNTGDLVAADGALKIILSNFFADKESFNPKTLQFIDTLSYINANITQKVTVSDLAKRANLHEVYFSNSFKKTFGMTLQHYIIFQRIEYACSLLSTRKHTIKEIAFMLNFTDESHFSRSFKVHTGFSPKEFQSKL